MKKKVAINGLGRIGKHAVRILLSRFNDTLELVAINAPDHTALSVAYAINYDSVYGYFEDYDIQGRESNLFITPVSDPTKTTRVQLFATHDATTLPWKDLDIDIVIECSGAYKEYDKAFEHITSGAHKMVLSSPTKDPKIPTIVLGANESKILLENQILSNASCTTNCACVVLKALLGLGEIAFVNGVTVHAYTQSQSLLDKEVTKGLREGRAGALNIIPTSTGASSAIEQVLPELHRRIDLMSMRVPVPSGSVVYLNIETKTEYTKAYINEYLAKYAKDSKTLFYSEEELVSSDIIGTPYSAIIDGLSTEVHGKHIRIVAWYDNEWGYTNRLIEVASQM